MDGGRSTSVLLPELIADILSRLPVKSLLRFRCVSKSWCALIDSPNFIQLHLNHSIRTRTNLHLIIQDFCAPCLYSIDLESLEKTVKLDCRYTSGDPKLRGSCNGLLCLSGSNHGDTILWNPSTKKHLKLPILPIEVPQSEMYFGFGFDSKISDYKVVRIVQYYEDHNVPLATEVRVYSLKSNSWGIVEDFPYYLALAKDFHLGVLVSGSVHWTGTVKPEFHAYHDYYDLIVAFDFEAEKFQLLPSPEPDNPDALLCIWDLERSLCAVRFCNGLVFDIWVMEEYGVHDSWTKLISIPYSSEEKPLYLKPITYLSNGEKVLIENWLDEDMNLISYDLERKAIEDVYIFGMPVEFDTMVYLESLVPLEVEVDVIGRNNHPRAKRRRGP